MEQKEYKTVGLTSWVKVGEGGNGITYEIRPIRMCC